MDNQFDPRDKPFDAPDAVFLPPAEPRPKGCFFYGCLFLAILGVLGLIAFGAIAFMGYRYYAQAIEQYTSTAPEQIPVVALPDDQRKSLDERVAAFKQAMDKGEASELVLTADEINTLISEQANLKGRVFVTIKGDKVSGKVSIPLGETGLPLTKGRFLNGSTTLTVSLRDGELIVHAKDFEVNGKTPPDNFKQQIANENLAKEYTKQPENAAMVRKFESIDIKDDKIYIKVRKQTDSADEKTSKSGDEAEKPKDEPAKEAPKTDSPDVKEDAPKVEEKPKADTPDVKEDAPKKSAA